MVLGDPRYTCNLKWNGSTIKCRKEEKVLGSTSDDKRTFMSHLGNTIKRAWHECFSQKTLWINWIISMKNAYCLLQTTDLTFNELLELLHELSIRNTCPNYLMIEVYKYLHGLSLGLMTDICTLRKNLYNILSIRCLVLKMHGQCVLEWVQQCFVVVSCGKKYP